MFHCTFFQQVLQQFGEFVVIELAIRFGNQTGSQLRKYGYEMVGRYFGQPGYHQLRQFDIGAVIEPQRN